MYSEYISRVELGMSPNDMTPTTQMWDKGKSRDKQVLGEGE